MDDTQSAYSVSIWGDSDAASVINAVNYVNGNGRRSSLLGKLERGFNKWTQQSMVVSGARATTHHTQAVPSTFSPTP